MKKSFVYLAVVLIMATMLCACGMDSDDGLVGNSPRPTDYVDIIPSSTPDVATSMIPSVEPSADTNSESRSPQVGGTDSAKASPKVGESNAK